jgi:hypothetical protein
MKKSDGRYVRSPNGAVAVLQGYNASSWNHKANNAPQRSVTLMQGITRVLSHNQLSQRSSNVRPCVLGRTVCWDKVKVHGI